MQTYTVKSGDTLYGISNQFGVSVSDLARANNISNTSSLQVGQVLNIPSISGSNPSTTFTYTVKKGDSLYAIAKKYNTTVNDIVSLNNLKTTSLSIGQTLKIPEEYTLGELTLPSYENYTVKKGDTLYKIAQKYGITPDVIMKDNSLTNTTLQIGQILRIRKLVDTTEVEDECFGDDYTPPTEVTTQNYVVQKGDSLYKIANKFNTTVNNLISLNGLANSNLFIGQVLRVPGASSGSGSISTTYTVQSGDSLYRIAQKFNTTVDNIKKKNNLTSNLLSIGQKLII